MKRVTGLGWDPADAAPGPASDEEEEARGPPTGLAALSQRAAQLQKLAGTIRTAQARTDGGGTEPVTGRCMRARDARARSFRTCVEDTF